jgi:hypothetical protein
MYAGLMISQSQIGLFLRHFQQMLVMMRFELLPHPAKATDDSGI